MLEALESAPPTDAIGLIVQIALMLLASLGAGVAFGRFWFSRSLEIKNSTIQNLRDRLVSISERIESAESLEKLRKDVETIRNEIAYGGESVAAARRMNERLMQEKPRKFLAGITDRR